MLGCPDLGVGVQPVRPSPAGFYISLYPSVVWGGIRDSAPFCAGQGAREHPPGWSRSRQRTRTWPGAPAEGPRLRGHPRARRGSAAARAPQPRPPKGSVGAAWGAGFQNGISIAAARDAGGERLSGSAAFEPARPAPSTLSTRSTGPGSPDQDPQQQLSEPSLTTLHPDRVGGLLRADWSRERMLPGQQAPSHDPPCTPPHLSLPKRGQPQPLSHPGAGQQPQGGSGGTDPCGLRLAAASNLLNSCKCRVTRAAGVVSDAL